MVFEIVYIGSSAIGLERLAENSGFAIRDVLCLENRVTTQLVKSVAYVNLTLTTFRWHNDFKELVLKYSASMPFFIYQLDMLVPADLTGRNRFFNLHRGDLTANRGPNPDIWPILLGHTDTAMSLHQINDKIDSGLLIDTYRVPIERDDDVMSVRLKLEGGLPQLVESLHEHLLGGKRGRRLEGGTYYPWVTEEHFTIDLENDDICAISRKIRSQSVYNGAIIRSGSHRHYVAKLLSVVTVASKLAFRVEEHGAVLRAYAGTRVLEFEQNMNPRHPPPPVRPPATRI